MDIALIVLTLIGTVIFVSSMAYALDRRAKAKGALLTRSFKPNVKTGKEKVNLNQIDLIKENLKLENQLKRGAGAFFWIAIFSLINSIAFLTGSTWNFVIGLGITQVVDGLSLALPAQMGAGVAFMIDMGIAGIFVILGIFARKGYKWVFIIGMILYSLDGLLFLLVLDFWSIGFHILILFGIYGGLKALGKLQKIDQASVSAT